MRLSRYRVGEMTLFFCHHEKRPLMLVAAISASLGEPSGDCGDFLSRELLGRFERCFEEELNARDAGSRVRFRKRPKPLSTRPEVSRLELLRPQLSRTKEHHIPEQ